MSKDTQLNNIRVLGWSPPKYLTMVWSSVSCKLHLIISFSNSLVYSSTLIVPWVKCCKREWSPWRYEGGKNRDLSFAFILSQVLILSFLNLTILAHMLVHQGEAYFIRFRAISFTFLSSRMSLKSKTLSTVCIYSKNSSESSFPLNSGMSTLKQLKLGRGLLSLLLSLLGGPSSLVQAKCWLSLPVLSSWSEPTELDELTRFLPFYLINSAS